MDLEIFFVYRYRFYCNKYWWGHALSNLWLCQLCDEIISFLVISWKPRYDVTKFLWADETAHRTESLSKINKVHIILFGIPDYNCVRNIPRHVRALRVWEALKIPFWVIQHRSSTLLRVSPVGADILRIEKCQLPYFFFFFYLLNNLHFYTLHV